MIEIQRASSGRFAMQEIFPMIERISEKNVLRFVPISIMGVSGTVSRVKMNAKVRRP